VAIPAHLAKTLDLEKGHRHQVMTANGVTYAFNTQVNRLTIGDIILQDIRASINPSMTGNEILLGMSALKEIEFTQKGDQLILRQYAQ
jgi:aspartyl protease family protein